MGIGAFVLNPERQYVFKHTEYVSAKSVDYKTSDNVAEYMAMLSVLKFLDLNQLQDQEIIIAGDSEMIFHQMNLRWKAHKGDYKPYFVKARTLAQSFNNIAWKWIPKSQNTIAIALAELPIEMEKFK